MRRPKIIVLAALGLVGGAAFGCGDAPSDADTSPDAGAASDTPAPGGGNDTPGSDPRRDDAGGSDRASPKGSGCLRGQGDFSADGPYPVVSEDVSVEGFGSYTIFRPKELDAECTHPIVAWGNGSTVSGSAPYAPFNQRAASWGIVVIASHQPQPASGGYLAAGLDHLLAENENASSPLYHGLSGRAGVAGHSQGGLAANNTSGHSNVEAVVCIQGGGLPSGKVAVLCETGVGDPIRSLCTDTYRAANGPAFLADHAEADHLTPIASLGADSEAGKQYVRLYTAWLRCWLADDASACAMFAGSKDAPVCGDSSWATCEGRNF